MKERNESLDCLKGIAIPLVMFGHVQVHNHMTDPYLMSNKTIQMPMFFLTAGIWQEQERRLPIWSNIEKRSADGQWLICFRSFPGWWCSI